MEDEEELGVVPEVLEKMGVPPSRHLAILIFKIMERYQDEDDEDYEDDE